MPFLDKYIHRDVWYDIIFAPNEKLDDMTLSLLSVISPALVKYFRVAVQEHLPGGEFHNLESSEVRGIPLHNKFPERMFGYFKQLLVYMPNVKELTAKGFTLTARNETSKWLSAKSDEERRVIVNQARRNVPTLRRRYKERQVS